MFSDLLRKLDVNMRAFIVLGFLIAAANAASLGYQYGPGVQSSSGLLGAGSQLVGSTGGSLGLGGGVSSGLGHSHSTQVISSGGLSGLSGSGSLGGGLVSSGSYGGNLVGSGSLGSGLVSTVGLGSGLVSSGSYGGNVVTSGSLNGGTTTVVGLDALNSVPQTVEISKQYFHYDAPEEPYNQGSINRQLSNVLKKNLQVVFIKAPENNAATNAALQLAKQAIEQRTAIYVLSKEHDGNQLIGQIQQIQENVPTAPEVKFIKYKTAQDIAVAKNAIQAQYDNLGGSSEVINGGVAPVLNYASQSAGGAIGIGPTLVSAGSGSYGSGSLLSSGSGSLGGGAILSAGGSGSLGGGAIISGGGLGGVSGSRTVVSKVVETASAPVSSEYLPPFKK